MDFTFNDIVLTGWWMAGYALLVFIAWCIFYLVISDDIPEEGVQLGFAWGFITSILSVNAWDTSWVQAILQHFPAVILLLLIVFFSISFLFEKKYLTWDLVLFAVPVFLSLGIFLVN